MVNVCCICSELIEDGDEIAMVIEGIYNQISSVSSFRLHRNVKFQTGTLRHIECGDEDDIE